MVGTHSSLSINYCACSFNESVSTVLANNLNSNPVSSGMSTICTVDQLTCRQIGVLDSVGFSKLNQQ